MAGYRYNKKQTVQDMLQLSVSWLVKQGYVKEGVSAQTKITWSCTPAFGKKYERGSICIYSNFIHADNAFLELDYRFRETENLKYQVKISKTNPSYGGVRYWLLCPSCGRRVACLYGGKYFLCRKCQNLCYETQQTGYSGRMIIKSQKYQEKVEDNRGLKKKGIHWKTFEEAMDKADFCESLGLTFFLRKY